MPDEATPMGRGEQHLVTGRTRPAVFMFQPTHYEVVTGDRLQEWEDALAERVGLRGLSLASAGSQAMSSCISFCPNFVDDCDQVEL